MLTNNVLKKTEQLIKDNSTTILTGFGVAGTITTAYLTGLATIKAVRIVDKDESEGGISGDRVERQKNRVRLVWKLYIPPVASCAMTIGCIVGSNRVSNRRAAAVVSAYSLLETGFTEYKDKVVEQLGVAKEERIRDEIAQDRIDAKPPTEVIIAGDGEVLCCELYTMRYFKSDIETLRKAANDINYEMNQGVHASLAEFYYAIGMPVTSISNDVGWDNDQLLELKFTTTLSPDDKPCLAFEYNYIKPL
jgi:hypothetical protein